MIANIIVEQTKDGDFSCFVEEEIPYVGLLGYGDSSEEAIKNLKDFYYQMKAELKEEGKILPDLEFVVHYDMPSFFDRFNFLNQSKIAERAGINPSLMRNHASLVPDVNNMINSMPPFSLSPTRCLRLHSKIFCA